MEATRGRPGSKKCLKVWLGVLLTLTYIIIIFFTMWTRRIKEQNEYLRRVELPNGIDRPPDDFHVKTLPDKKFHKEVVYQNENLPRVNDEYFNPPSEIKEYVNKVVSHSPNETEMRITVYPNTNKTHFAVFGFTTPRSEDHFYAFCAPLAVRAWRRIGYESIVFIIGDVNEWETNKILKHIYSELVSLGAAVVFLKSKLDNEILISQGCRLFTANYFSWKSPQTTFIVTSDVDLWPLNAAVYDIPIGKKIMSLNSDCCGSFDHRGHIYKLLPLGNIVTDVDTWKDIINVNGFFPRTVPEILDYFFRDFGPLAMEKTRKDEYIGWYMDQRMMSMRLSDWMTKNGGINVQFVPRDVGRDRIDVNYWMPYSLHGRSDIHILSGAYKPGIWEKIRPLIKLMYSQDEEYKIVEYREKFMKLYIYSRRYT